MANSYLTLQLKEVLRHASPCAGSRTRTTCLNDRCRLAARNAAGGAVGMRLSRYRSRRCLRAGGARVGRSCSRHPAGTAVSSGRSPIAPYRSDLHCRSHASATSWQRGGWRRPAGRMSRHGPKRVGHAGGIEVLPRRPGARARRDPGGRRLAG